MHRATPYEQAKANIAVKGDVKDKRIQELESELESANCMLEQTLSDNKALRVRAHKLANDAQTQYANGYEDGMDCVYPGVFSELIKSCHLTQEEIKGRIGESMKRNY